MKQLHGIILAGLINLATLTTNKEQSIKPSELTQTIQNSKINNIAKNTIIQIDSLRSKIYPYKNSKPTTQGINDYVIDQTDIVINDFQKFFNVEIENMSFDVDNPKDYVLGNEEDEELIVNEEENNKTDSPVPETLFELGIYYSGEDYAIIFNEEKYLGYSLKDTKKRVLSNIEESNKFVRAVMIHELAHNYFEQIINELRYEKKPIAKEYLPKYQQTTGAKFIEEGIAEYCANSMNEVLNTKPDKVYKPKTIEDILDKKNTYNVYYKYSAFYIDKVFKNRNLRSGIKLVVMHSAPTIEEIIDPEKYITRINKIDIK